MDRLVEASVNASLPRSIDARTLAHELTADQASRDWLPHVVAFFCELPVDAIESFAATHGISTAQLRRCYGWMTSVTGEHAPDVDQWLGYLEVAPRPRR